MTLKIYEDAEQWRTISELPSFEVSNHGRVRMAVQGYRKPKGSIVPIRMLYGYEYVSLWHGGKAFSRRVNRLVCQAFHGDPPDPSYHAAHNDGTRDNNHFTNLRWADPSSNMQDKVKHGTVPTGDRNGARLYPERLARGLKNGKHTKPLSISRGEQSAQAKLKTDQVLEIRADQRPSRQIARAYGVSRGAIVGIKTGKTWSHI